MCCQHVCGGVAFLLFVGIYLPPAAGAEPRPDGPKPTARPEVAASEAAPPGDAGDNAEHSPDAASPAPEGAEPLPPDVGYYDEPPLDYPQRLWRRYTREVKPQHFAPRDLRRQYGYNPPFTNYGFGYGGAYGYGPWGGFGTPGVDPGAAYIQGRYDERRFREWKVRYEKGRAAYVAAMTDGVRLFRETDYAGAVGHFVRASRLNQGDPASRLHAAYALVAIGNYAEAAPMIVRAIELQTQLPYLPLSIREEYGPKVDFDAHWQRLREAANVAEDDAELWFLVAFYAHFTKDRSTAQTAIDNVRICAPEDYDDYALELLAEAARLLTPSAPSEVAVPAEPE